VVSVREGARCDWGNEVGEKEERKSGELIEIIDNLETASTYVRAMMSII
jgi:hypothetical protein